MIKVKPLFVETRNLSSGQYSKQESSSRFSQFLSVSFPLPFAPNQENTGAEQRKWRESKSGELLSCSLAFRGYSQSNSMFTYIKVSELN